LNISCLLQRLSTILKTEFLRRGEMGEIALQFQSTTITDLDAVAEALLAAFKAAPDAPFVDRRLLRWKYFEDGPSWEGTRSYLLTQGNDVQAHCGVWPINLGFAGGIVTCLCFTDWIGSREFPGAGSMLRKKVLNFAETSIVVGGSDYARAAIPRLNYGVAGTVSIFARVVRPWKQFCTRPTEGIGKDVARLARNILWSRAPAGVIAENWSAARMRSFDSSFPPLLKRHSGVAHPTPERCARYLNYWLRCPAAEIAGFSILKESRIQGYFLLARVGGQARIIDIRLTHEDDVGRDKQADWNAAYGLAAKIAEADPETCEILAVASTEFAQEALLSSGFRRNGSFPLALYDPQGKLSAAPAIFWNMIDGDIAYFYNPAFPYNT
jgi:hypothetical protein